MAKRGYCSECHREVAVRKDGTAMKHGHRQLRDHDGSVAGDFSSCKGVGKAVSALASPKRAPRGAYLHKTQDRVPGR